MSQTRLTHKEHGQGTIVADNGDVLVVEFDSGTFARVLRSETTPILSVDEVTQLGRTGQPLAVLAKVMGAAIRSTNDRWGVFCASRVALLPHQLWVAYKVLERWPSRWLIADDVGLGKTIEAGLILSPLLSRGRVHRLLILTPAALVPQWQTRLRQMFDIRSATYHPEVDKPSADFWNTHRIVVASMHTLRLDHRDRWQRILEADPWDMVLVDEAHHLNADERSGRTLGLELLEQMDENRKIGGMLFLTGTPHRGKDFGFLSLLSLLDRERFNPRRSLDEQLEHLAKVMIRNNKQNVTDMSGRRQFQPIRVHDQTYAYSDAESEFYDQMTRFIVEGHAYAGRMKLGSQRTMMLVLITLQKLAASSIAAVCKALERRVNRLKGLDGKAQRDRKAYEEAWKELQALAQANHAATLDRRARLEETIDQLMEAVELNPDEIPRLEELIALAKAVGVETRVRLVEDLVQGLPAAESVLIFTEYKATQALLAVALRQTHGADAVGFINGEGRLELVQADGGVREWRSDRQATAAAFNEGKVRFLLSTEAAGEGIDLQRQCHTLVHFDMPWNPMRMHQRVGRLNRYGQTHPVDVHILRNPATVESRIWLKLNQKLDRIAIAFQSVMADPEDIHALVLGMTSDALFDHLATGAAQRTGDSWEAWFDQETATFGGDDAVKFVEALIGHPARFDFGRDVAAVPKVDLPDLRPFLKAALALRGRRLDRKDGDSFGFLTPAEWREKHWAMKERYDRVCFDRQRPAEHGTTLLGAGHITMEAALSDVGALVDAIALIPGLNQPLAVFAIQDGVTSAEASTRRVVVGAELDNSAWTRLDDWQLITKLNPLLDRLDRQSDSGVKAIDPVLSQRLVSAAKDVANAWLTSLDLPFRRPNAQLLALLLPADSQSASARANGSATVSA
jgi:superfamily II DNA or RNA helicase